MRKSFILSFILLLNFETQAGLVGDFSNTNNFPGFIDLNPDSESYLGPNIKNPNFGDGVITDTPSKLISSYLFNGKINIKKIEDVIADIRRTQENARVAYCQAQQSEDDLTQEGCNIGFPREKLLEKWNKKSINIAYEYAISLFQEAISHASAVTSENINAPASAPFLLAFFDGLEIYQGVVAESSQMGRYSGVIKTVKMLAENLRAVTITKDRAEAANIPRTDGVGANMFYSPEELKELKAQGTDISLLDPPDSGFWRNPKKAIRAVSTQAYDGEEKTYFEQLLGKKEIDELMDAETPINVVYELEPPKGTGETPKFIVKYGKSTLKVKFMTDIARRRSTTDIGDEAMRVIRNMEVNTETVVNNLASALGFSVDGTYYKRSVRVFFPKEIYESNGFDEEHKRIVQVMKEYYKAFYNVTSALNSVKTDPKTGRKYFELRSVQLERKSDEKTDMNIGFFIRKGLGKSLKREHRGFALFLAWVWDVDSKDANDALKLVPYQDDAGKLKYKVVMSNSDMASTLGSNRPNIYNFRLIKNSIKDDNGYPEYVRFNYLRVYPNDLLDAISFEDARWMARLISQLTEEQIYTAFLGAGYNEVISKYYTGLMLKKRNDLIDALGLDSIPKLPQFNGTIEGHEEFFLNGFLTDPENKLWNPELEPFPSFWGSGHNLAPDEPQGRFIRLLKIRLLSSAGYLIYNSILSKSGVTTEGLKFSEIIIPSRDQANGCAGECFFHGANAGVEGFIPWRFIVENPDQEAKTPFLVIDIFRIGFFLGGKAQGVLGLDIPQATAMGIGGNHYQISEFIKVRPVEEIGDLLTEKSGLLKMPLLNFKNIRAQAIDNLKENEILIQSHYIGLRAKAKISPNISWSIPITPSITFRGDIMRANRVTYMGKEQGKILVGWDKLIDRQFNTRLNLLDYLVKLPILESEHKKLNSIQRTFEFDRNKEVDRKVLFANVNKILPKDIPEEYFTIKRATDFTERRFSMGFFSFFRKTTLRRKISVDFEDAAANFTSSNVNYVREIHRQRLTKRLGSHTSEYKIQASLNGQKEVFARIRLNGNFENMTKYKFKRLLAHYTPMLPQNFIQFDPEEVKENFGTLLMNIETIFPEAGLKNVFDPSNTKETVCLVYAKVHSYDWNQKDCSYIAQVQSRLFSGLSSAKKRYLKWWKNYSEVRVAFWELLIVRNQDKNSLMQKKLKKMVDIMTDKGGFAYRTMNLFIALSEQNNYYRRASMYSSLEAFPGQTDTVRQDRNSQGEFKPTVPMRADRPEEEFELFSDQIHKTLQNMFYNQQYVNDNISG